MYHNFETKIENSCHSGTLATRPPSLDKKCEFSEKKLAVGRSWQSPIILSEELTLFKFLAFF